MSVIELPSKYGISADVRYAGTQFLDILQRVEGKGIPPKPLEQA
jgi:hypothetical protein